MKRYRLFIVGLGEIDWNVFNREASYLVYRLNKNTGEHEVTHIAARYRDKTFLSY